MSDTFFTFETTHHALWAEEIARERSIPSEIVPTPAAATARCNLALVTLPHDIEHFATVLDTEGIPYVLFSTSEDPS